MIIQNTETFGSGKIYSLFALARNAEYLQVCHEVDKVFTNPLPDLIPGAWWEVYRPANLRAHPAEPEDIRTRHYARVSCRYLILCGWSAAAPRRAFLSASYSE